MLRLFKFNKATYFEESMSSAEMFVSVLNLINSSLRPIGANIFSPGWTIHNIWAYLTVLNLCVYIIINMWNIFMFSDDLIKLFFCMVTTGGGFQVKKILCIFNLCHT